MATLQTFKVNTLRCNLVWLPACNKECQQQSYFGSLASHLQYCILLITSFLPVPDPELSFYYFSTPTIQYSICNIYFYQSPFHIVSKKFLEASPSNSHQRLHPQTPLGAAPPDPCRSSLGGTLHHLGRTPSGKSAPPLPDEAGSALGQNDKTIIFCPNDN